MGETIHTVIWLCDLRGLTTASETLSRDALIELLNAYFGPMCEAVEANGGEVLKFIGDAMLAIFPTEGAPERACARALATASQVGDTPSEANARRAEAGLMPSPMGSPSMWRTSCTAISAAPRGSTSP